MASDTTGASSAEPHVAAVDFFCHYPINIYDFAPIVRTLRAKGVDARLVIEPPSRNRANQVVFGVRRMDVDEDMFATLIQLSIDEGLIPLLHGRYKSAAAAVTNGPTGLIPTYEGKKIRADYGVGAFNGSYSHGGVNSGFDGVLVHGEWSKELVSQWGVTARVMGFPKYRASHGSDAEYWRRHWNLDPQKKTIAYFSTWSAHSSLDSFSKVIAELAEQYNVLYKPHPLNRRFEHSRYDALRRSHVVVEDDVHNIVPFITVADLVVADDRSGAFTEPMLCDTPVIGLSLWGSTEADNLIDMAPVAAPICTSPADLAELVDQMLTNDTYGPGRTAMKSRLFADLHGDDAEAAAFAIMDIAEIESARLPGGQHLDPEVSVIIRSTGNEVALVRCLDSLIQQSENPPFEVIVVGTATISEEVRHHDDWPFPVHFLEALSDYTARGALTILMSEEVIAPHDVVSGHAGSHAIQPGSVMSAPVINGAPEPCSLLSAVAYEFVTQNKDAVANVSFATELFPFPAQWFGRENAVTDLLQRAGALSIEQIDLTHARCLLPKPASVSVVQSAVEEVGRASTRLAARCGVSFSPYPSLPDDKDGLRRVTEDALTKTSEAVFVLEEVASVRTALTTQFDDEAPATQEGMRAMVTGVLEHLLPIWTAQGTAQALSQMGATHVPSLSSACAQLVPTAALNRYLAWPDYRVDDDLDVLMKRAAMLSGSSNCICLVHDEDRDGSLEDAMAQVEAAYLRNLSDDTELEMCFVKNAFAVQALRQLPILVDCFLALPSSAHGERARLTQLLGLPVIA